MKCDKDQLRVSTWYCYPTAVVYFEVYDNLLRMLSEPCCHGTLPPPRPSFLEIMKIDNVSFCVAHAEVFQVRIPLQGSRGEGPRSRSVGFPAHHAQGGRRSVPGGGAGEPPLSRQAREPPPFEGFRSSASSSTTTTTTTATTDREGGEDAGREGAMQKNVREFRKQQPTTPRTPAAFLRKTHRQQAGITRALTHDNHHPSSPPSLS